MKQIKRLMQTLPEDVTLTRIDFVLAVAIGALAGTIVGMLISPRKYMHIGCDNNNHTSFDLESEEKKKD